MSRDALRRGKCRVLRLCVTGEQHHYLLMEFEMKNQNEVSANDLRMIASVSKHTDAQATTLAKLGERGIKAVFSRQNSDLLNATINGIPVNLRAPFATWLRQFSIVVDAIPASEALVRNKYNVQRFPRDSKKQEQVFSKLKANDYAPMLPKEGKVYVAPEKKVLDESAAEAEKRAVSEMTKVISRLKERDPSAGAMLNMLWSHKMVQSEVFIDSTGAVITLSVDEVNAVTSFLQELRK